MANNSKSRAVNWRLPNATYEFLLKISKEDVRTLSSTIIWLIERYRIERAKEGR